MWEKKEKNWGFFSLFFKALVICEAKPENSGFIETGADVMVNDYYMYTEH